MILRRGTVGDTDPCEDSFRTIGTATDVGRLGSLAAPVVAGSHQTVSEGRSGPRPDSTFSHSKKASNTESRSVVRIPTKWAEGVEDALP